MSQLVGDYQQRQADEEYQGFHAIRFLFKCYKKRAKIQIIVYLLCVCDEKKCGEAGPGVA